MATTGFREALHQGIGIRIQKQNADFMLFANCFKEGRQFSNRLAATRIDCNCNKLAPFIFHRSDEVF